MDAFWPGPLTLIFPLLESTVSAAVTRGKTTIGVRMPNHAVALALLELANVPIAAPSANLSGNPSPTTAAQVAADLDGRIAAIVTGSICNIGEASTIVDVCGDIPVILRQGAISAMQLEEVLGIPIKAVNA
jgi:L-threonylcarbamoyladenylate synthase